MAIEPRTPISTRNGAAAGAPTPEFAIEGAEAWPFAATPRLRLRLRVAAAPEMRIDSMLLDAQVRIAPRRRPYGAGERELLRDLFGQPEQWGASLQTFLWESASVFVPGFAGETTVDLPLTCTYDFEVTAARYLHSLEDGVVPLELLFSGTVLHSDAGGQRRVTRVPLDSEARFELPVALWRETVDHYFHGSPWLRLERGSFDRLYAYRSRNALPSWEAAVERLLEGAGE